MAALVAVALAAGGCNLFRGGQIEAVPIESARTTLRNAAGQLVGEATLRQTPNGLLIRLELAGAPPGVHGFHIHETGQCSPTFEAAGGHYAPRGREHGFLDPAGPHAGDLTNIHVPESGRLVAEKFAPNVRLVGDDGLLDADGSALVIHANADDYETNPSGNSGERIICGVVGR